MIEGVPAQVVEVLGRTGMRGEASSVKVRVLDGDDSAIPIEADAGTDRLSLRVFGNMETGQARLVATLDNLGKGAAGAAVQNFNLMAGFDQTAGLTL